MSITYFWLTKKVYVCTYIYIKIVTVNNQWICGWQPLRWHAMNPVLPPWNSHPCVIFPWVWASDWLLHVAEMIGYHFYAWVTKRLQLLSWTFSLPHWLGLKLAAMLWTTPWRSPHDKELREASSQQPVRTCDPQSNSPWGTESGQQPHEWAWIQIFPQTSLHMSLKTLTAASWETLSQRHPAKQCLGPWPTETVTW